ncbi:ATP-binding protein [Sphingobium xenophagum]|uniref:ATP-binding protein n=1 Tax=Sphingobium xenophagum TaxID=121428 RepID=UPI0013EE8AA7|nr:ATP-binding protein [Sphingobium xenophagum]
MADTRPPLPIGEQSAWSGGDRTAPEDNGPDELYLDESSMMLEELQHNVSSGLDLATQRVRIADAFNSTRPVGDRYELSGRLTELQILVEAMIDRKNHAIIYGARGVGKTSIARVFGDLVDEAGRNAYYHSASGDADFEELMRPYVTMILDNSVRLPGREHLDALGERFSARDLADALASVGSQKTFLILDEFDRITNRRARAETASLLKLLSDYRASVQMVIVGISTDVAHILDDHPSLRRHLVAVRIGPIADHAARRLLEEGCRRGGITLSEDVADALIRIAGGSPYHARTFALAAGLAAIGAQRETVDQSALLEGVEAAWRDWSALSPRTARLFQRIANREQDVAGLWVLALLAAQEHMFDRARLSDTLTDAKVTSSIKSDALAGELIAKLDSELNTEDGMHSFSDSLAPQYLLVAWLRAAVRNETFLLPEWTKCLAELANSVKESQ